MAEPYISIGEKIWQAVSNRVADNIANEFTIAEISDAIGLSSYHMGSSFQGMRQDQPGGAPKVKQRLQNVFRRVRHGHYVLSDYGVQLLRATTPAAITTAQALEAETAEVVNNGYFDKKLVHDDRERKLREIVQRRGQPKFRRELLSAYEGRCCITGCDATEALEAAHISPYSGPESNTSPNGLLLRADIHTLFDLDLIGIDPSTVKVALSKSLRKTEYISLDNVRLHFPTSAASRPNKIYLQARWEKFNGHSIAD